LIKVKSISDLFYWFFCPAGDFGEVSLRFDFGHRLSDGSMG